MALFVCLILFYTDNETGIKEGKDVSGTGCKSIMRTLIFNYALDMNEIYEICSNEE